MVLLLAGARGWDATAVAQILWHISLLVVLPPFFLFSSFFFGASLHFCKVGGRKEASTMDTTKDSHELKRVFLKLFACIIEVLYGTYVTKLSSVS